MAKQDPSPALPVVTTSTSASTSATPSPVRCIRQAFSVPFQYEVVFARDVLAPESTVLVDAICRREPQRVPRVLPVLDGGLEAAWPELRGWLTRYFHRHAARLALAGAPATVIGGEAAKNDPAVVAALHELFFRQGLDRHCVVLVIGGGAVQDAAGYAAATAHRGLRTVRMPTTVLSQNDSGVGVKNGVNLHGAKNFVGTFVPPFAVINDARFLERLPARDRVAGLAETIKVALIRDADFFALIEQQVGALASFDAAITDQVIQRSAELHLRHIATGGDPFEQGSARPLDFGHWAAHKLESMTAHELRHGEAVGLGLLLDGRYSVEAGLLAEAAFLRLARVVRAVGLPTWHPALGERDADGRLAVMTGLEDFRQHLGGDLTVTLLPAIGQAIEVHEMRAELIEKALGWLRAAAGPP
ncbi:MAG TPA: 3-dehydroquinate synthase [Polyangia bacterium]|nr:3-dehydroquinate synthase [Polyangia bacterium]